MLQVKIHETERTSEEIYANTTNECFYCTKDSKDCLICIWR